MRLSLKLALVTVAVIAFASPAAFADTSESSNWAGYAVHRSGVAFREVLATWRQPVLSCAAGEPGYSAVWIGLGGYSETSSALEQVGTEADCSFSGATRSSSWYELVPAPSRGTRLSVRQGDLISASVKVVGHTVSVKLDDLTARRSFTKTVRDPTVDLSSADWILEAPSDCVSATVCQTLPLANFGSASFGQATAVSSTGRKGSISSRAWSATKINLVPGARRFVSNGSGDVAGAATTSALTPRGSAFTVSYYNFTLTGPFYARRASLSSGYLEHPGR